MNRRVAGDAAPDESLDGPDAGAARPLRLHLDASPSTTRCVDGAWWPYSSDATQELGHLVTGAERALGRIDRVALHEADWPDHPRRIEVDGRVIPLGFFSSGANLASLVRRHGDDVVLLLIPPTASADEAATAIGRAVDSEDRSRPGDLLAPVQDASATARPE